MALFAGGQLEKTVNDGTCINFKLFFFMWEQTANI
jgi:hypothetical protein